MLQKISIQNYAIIDELEISFSGKLNIITGETGAGKSIIAGALGLVLGDRADTTVLVNKEKKCIVEGVFNVIGNKLLSELLEKNELEFHSELVIRREISTNGKSRAFINDSLVNLSQLSEISSVLVDLHRQFDTFQLSENEFQRQVLDALANHPDLLITYKSVYQEWKHAMKKFEELTQQKLQFDKEADYNKFQYDELSETGFRENELEEIDAELKMLSNAEEIKTVLAKTSLELIEGESPLVQQLKMILNQLQVFSDVHPELKELTNRLQSSQVEIQDIANEITLMGEKINYDPEKIQLMDERLSLGYRLLKKHGVQNTNELLEVQKQLEEKLQAVLDIDEAIQKMLVQKEKLLAEAKSIAANISEGRKKQVKPFETKINKLLSQVGMPNAKLKVAVIDEMELNSFGNNSIEFLFDANLPDDKLTKEHNFLPLKKVASGGELNRLMLCIKSLVASRIDMPSLVFDEIDTGISGEAARQVGVILKELSGNRQIICITHQPQIAGNADAHLFVYKEIEKDKIKTNIRLLSFEERITTIAKMLSGEKPTAAAIENAREMVRN